MRVRLTDVPPNDVRRRWRVPVTEPARTVWELPQSLAFDDAVRWGDALAHCARLTPADLMVVGWGRRDRQGGPPACQTVSYLDGRSESPQESTARVSLIRAGLPVPVPQFEVFHEGYFVARVDLAWPWAKLAVEYDGAHPGLSPA